MLCILYLLQVDLSRNHLKEVPLGLKKLKNLRVLNLSHNELSRVPDALFDGLYLLKSLDLSNNKLVTFQVILFWMMKNEIGFYSYYGIIIWFNAPYNRNSVNILILFSLIMMKSNKFTTCWGKSLSGHLELLINRSCSDCFLVQSIIVT